VEIAWTAVGVLVLLLLGGTLTLAGRNPPEFRAARVCLWTSALLLCEMDIVWRINTQQTLWFRLLTGIAIWGAVGAGIPEGLRWIAKRQTDASAQRIPVAPIPSGVNNDSNEFPGETSAANPLARPGVSAAEIAPEQATRTRPNSPVVDFLLTPENIDSGATISHIPSLTLVIHNRGSSDITDVTMRVTEYQLDARTVTPEEVRRLPRGIRIQPETFEDYIYSVHQYHEQPVGSGRIASGEKSPAYNLATIQPFRFAKYHHPGDPDGAGLSVPLKESDSMRFYALRISFLNSGDRGRYAAYRVICSEHPYSIASDGPSSGAGGHWGRWTAGFTAPFRLIIAHQREMYASAPGIEYTGTPQYAGEPPHEGR
jgi:hypothetical protein